MTTLEDWLDDLCVRFILNIPAEELQSLERICFQIEEAQWYYEDFIRPSDPSLPSLNLKPFFKRITPRCPILQDWPQQEMDRAFESFILYKQRVPVRGVILLNDTMDEVLLVKGWKKSGTWSFPRGKINKGEDDLDCAIREAWEETGFDLRQAGLVKDPKKIKHIEKTMRAQNMKLFVFRGVPRDASFVPQTRKEISKIEWFRLADLPTEKRRAPQEGNGQHLVLNANKFYVVAPFVNDLKKIINAERKKDQRQSSRAAAAAAATAAIPGSYMSTPMSPAVPSSLPEVTVAPSMAIPSIQTHSDATAKSNALLALLRNGPTEAVAIQERPQVPNPPHSPEQFIRPHPNIILQSPQPTSDFHQQVHPTAPPSSALPSLSHHTRSLLDAFTKPSIQSPPTRQIPLDKQSLLAAFGASPSIPTASPQPIQPAMDQGSNLLRLLQRTPEVPQAVMQQSVPQQQAPARIPPPVQQTPFVNPLMNLLKTQKPAEQPQSLDPPSISAPAASQIQPIELSATPKVEKVQPAPKSKDDLLSLLGATSKAEALKNVTPKTRSGTTSATLDQPIDQPQFDAISRAPTLKADAARPAAGEKKLFDHKTGSIRAVPPKPIAIASPKSDDRLKAQKSPRQPRQKQQVNSPSRRPFPPKEPKEIPKPFQPQILKRSQLADGDDLSSILPLRQKEERVEEASSPELPPVKMSDSGLPMPLLMDSGLISPSLKAPQPLLSEYDPIYRPDLYPPQKPPPMAAPVPDPQRDALLALLKSPVKAPVKSPSPISLLPDLDATPKASAPVPQPQVSLDDVISPPPTSQVISPVHEPEPFNSLPRSRVSSLASTANGLVGTKPVLEKRQTAANEKAFLLNYLKGLSGHEATA